MANLNTLSFLIASFNDVINNFGSSKKSIDFYKNQVENLISIGQIEQTDVNYITDLINFSYVTDSDKWKVELEKVNYFSEVMDIIISSSDLNKDKIAAIIDRMQLKASGKTEEKVLRIIRRIFEIPEKPEININKASNFGTNKFAVKSNAQSSKSSNTNKMNINDTVGEDSKWYSTNKSALGNLLHKVIVDNLNADEKSRSYIIKYKNLQAVCSSDPTYLSISIMDLNRLYTGKIDPDRSTIIISQLDKLYRYKNDGAKVEVGYKHEVDYGCSTHTEFIVDDVSTADVLKFLEDYVPSNRL